MQPTTAALHRKREKKERQPLPQTTAPPREMQHEEVQHQGEVQHEEELQHERDVQHVEEVQCQRKAPQLQES